MRHKFSRLRERLRIWLGMIEFGNKLHDSRGMMFANTARLNTFQSTLDKQRNLIGRLLEENSKHAHLIEELKAEIKENTKKKPKKKS